MMVLALAGCSRTPTARPSREPIPGTIRNSFHFDLHHPKKDESLSSLSRDFGVPIGVLSYINGLHADDRLPRGKAIKVPFWEELFRGPPLRPDMPQLMWPVLGGVLTSPFGPRWGRQHSGIDIRAAVGEPIFASHGGRVVFVGNQGGYGNVVELETRELSTFYAHLSHAVVRKGQRVAQGDLLAFAGASGNVTGPHCHFEVRLPQSSTARAPNNTARAPIDPSGFFPRGPLLARVPTKRPVRSARLERASRRRSG
jgi:hypothetical protein